MAGMTFLSAATGQGCSGILVSSFIHMLSDSKMTFHIFKGPYLHSLELSKLRLCENAIKRDRETFGIDCVRNLVKYQEVHVEHLTDIARLKLEAENASTTESANADIVVVFNATILTMETGELSKDYVDKGSVVMKGGVIDYVGPEDMLSNWDGATSFDAEGGTGNIAPTLFMF